MREALRNHWPEYCMEAAELAIFMISASLFTVLLYHPASPAVRAIPQEFMRRALTGLAMGLTLIGLVYSPWGKRSGAHMNPAFTLTFWRLGKVSPWDAAFYSLAQFAGGAGGILLVATVARSQLSHPAVNYVVTVPGAGGPWLAFTAEAAISFLLVMVVLVFTNRDSVARFTGVVAGVCVAAFITFESPLSGMSMNPARTLGSAMLPHLWQALWVYFTAPPLGMLLAAEVYVLCKCQVACAKYHHQNHFRCIFCEYHATRPALANQDLDGASLKRTVASKGSFNLLGLVLAPAMLLITPGKLGAEAPPFSVTSRGEQISLLELFTSEGCSSCPPAESWLSGLKESPGLWVEFVPVAFHVDYWDYLGWRDPWGSKAFSDRQRAYAQRWHSDSLYTPGFVLNGQEWRAWSRRKQGPAAPGAITGILKVTSSDLVHWQASFHPTPPVAGGYEVHAALLGSSLNSEVHAGENRGRRLAHDFVALALATDALKSDGQEVVGEFKFDPAAKGQAKRLALATWITRRDSLEPLQAVGGWLPNP